MSKQRKGVPLTFPPQIEQLLNSPLEAPVFIAELPQQLGLSPTTTDAHGVVHRVQALKIFYLQQTPHAAKECYRQGGGAKYISATSLVGLRDPSGAKVSVYRTELFDCGNFGGHRQRGGFKVWPEQALVGDLLHCVFSSGKFVDRKPSHPAAKEVGGIPTIAATNAEGSASEPRAPAHTIVGVYADAPIISMTFDEFQPLCSAHKCAVNAAGTHCTYAHGKPCRRAKHPAYVMKHLILLRSLDKNDFWFVAARRDPYEQYRFETQSLSTAATTVCKANPSEGMILMDARLKAAEAAATLKKQKTENSLAAASSASSSAAAAGPSADTLSSEPLLTPVESQQRIIDQMNRPKKGAKEAAVDVETPSEAQPAARARKPVKKPSRAGNGSGVGAASSHPAAAAASTAGRHHKRKSSVMDDDSWSPQSSSAGSSRAPSSAGGKWKARVAINTNATSSDEEEEEEERSSSGGEEEFLSDEESAQVVSASQLHSCSDSPLLVRRGRPLVAPILLHPIAALIPGVLASPEPLPSHHTLGARCSSGSMPLSTPLFCRSPARPSMSPMSGGSSGFLRNDVDQPRRHSLLVSLLSSSQPASPRTLPREEPDGLPDSTMQQQPLHMRPLLPSQDLIRSLPMDDRSNPTTPGLPAVPSAIPPHHGGVRNASMSSLLRGLTINIQSALPAACPQASPQLPYDALSRTPLAPTPLSAVPGEIDILL